MPTTGKRIDRTLREFITEAQVLSNRVLAIGMWQDFQDDVIAEYDVLGDKLSERKANTPAQPKLALAYLKQTYCLLGMYVIAKINAGTLDPQVVAAIDSDKKGP